MTDQVAQLIRRLWWSAVLGAVIGALAGYGLSQVVPTRYTAHTEVLALPAPGASTDDAVDDRLLESFARLLGSRQIASQAHDAVEVDLSVSQVEAALTSQVIPGSTVVRVDATHRDPQTASDLSRAAADAFVETLVADGIAADPTDAPPSDDAPAARLTTSIIEQSPGTGATSTPDHAVWMAWGALAGAVLIAAWSVLRRATDRRVRDADDLDDISGAPLLGTFGYDRSASPDDLATDLEPTDARYEAARILRTNVQFLAVDADTAVLTFTSALPDEGKSTVVSDLAVALARGGQSVVLVEGDLRRPRLAAMFGLSGSVGLTTTLIGRAELGDVLQQTSVPGLDVLTSGTRPPNPSELLQTQAMADLITTLSHQYDVVLIDAPPLLPVTDAAILAEASDGAVLVVRHGRTTREQVRLAVDRLESAGAELSGTVLTMVPARIAAKYGYGYEYVTAPDRRDGRRARR